MPLIITTSAGAPEPRPKELFHYDGTIYAFLCHLSRENAAILVAEGLATELSTRPWYKPKEPLPNA